MWNTWLYACIFTDRCDLVCVECPIPPYEGDYQALYQVEVHVAVGLMFIVHYS